MSARVCARKGCAGVPKRKRACYCSRRCVNLAQTTFRPTCGNHGCTNKVKRPGATWCSIKCYHDTPACIWCGRLNVSGVDPRWCWVFCREAWERAVRSGRIEAA